MQKWMDGYAEWLTHLSGHTPFWRKANTLHGICRKWALASPKAFNVEPLCYADFALQLSYLRANLARNIMS